MKSFKPGNAGSQASKAVSLVVCYSQIIKYKLRESFLIGELIAYKTNILSLGLKSSLSRLV